MRRITRLLPLVLALALASLAGAHSRVEATNLYDHPFVADLPSGSHISMTLRSGDLRVLAGDDNRISVHVDGENAYRATDMKVRYDRSGDNAELSVSGGPRNGIRITVEVPHETGLIVRAPAGDLEIRGIRGDKDIELNAGDLTIYVGDPQDYSHVDAGVWSGDLEARPFGESHGGLFRSFSKSGSGKYRLHAHLLAGDLTLE